MVKLRTLGECVIEVGETEIAPDSKNVFGLLLYLGLERGKRIARSELIAMFWPTASPEKAAHSLRQTIYQCRKLGADIEATKTEITIRPELISCDLDGAEALLTADRRTAMSAFLPGYAPELSEQFTEWLDRHRSIVQAKLRRHLLIEMASRKSAGDWEGASATARDLLQIDPLNEEGTLVLAEATAMSGNKAEALHILDAFARDVNHNQQLTLPANVLKKRIAEQFKESDRAATPLIGRADLLAEVNQLLKHAKRGQGKSLLYWGQPGIGKTRLVTEIEKTAQLQGFQVARAECHLADATRPLSAFMEITPRLLQLRGALGCTPQSLALLRRLTEFESDGNLQEHEGDVSSQLRRALLDLLDAIVAESALLLVAEDVHWLDGASWELLSVLARWATTRPLLIVQTSRVAMPPNVQSEKLAAIEFRTLAPLQDADAHSLFIAAAPRVSTSLPEPDRDWFLAVAGGNPYFVTELARHYGGSGLAYTIPASLESLLSERVRKLSPAALRLLQVISVLGRQSTFHRFEKVLESETFELLAALEELEVQGLVFTDGAQVNPKHALLADNALGLCTPATRRLLHRRVAKVLESEFEGSHSATLLWMCTEHWRLAGDGDKAVSLARAGASHLLQLGLITEAVEILEGLLARVKDPTQQCETLSLLSRVHRSARSYHKTIETLHQLERVRSSLQSDYSSHNDDELRLIEVSWFAEFFNHTTRGPEYVARLINCVNAVESSPSHRLTAARWALAIADNATLPDRLDEIYAFVEPMLQESHIPVITRLWIQIIHGTVRGDLDNAIVSARKAVKWSREHGGLAELIRTLHNAAMPLRYAGMFREAETLLREAISLSFERRLWNLYVEIMDSLATLQLDNDRAEEAGASLELAAGKLPVVPAGYTGASLHLMQAQVAVSFGDFRKAREIQTMLRIPVTNPTVRGRDAAAALSSILDVAEGKHSNPELLRDLEATIAIGRGTGRRDFPMLGLVIGLCAQGEGARAEGLFTDYLRGHRRERYPLPTHLVQTLKQLAPQLSSSAALEAVATSK